MSVSARASETKKARKQTWRQAAIHKRNVLNLIALALPDNPMASIRKAAGDGPVLLLLPERSAEAACDGWGIVREKLNALPARRLRISPPLISLDFSGLI